MEKYHTNLGSLFLSESSEHVTVNNHFCSENKKANVNIDSVVIFIQS